MDKKGWIKQTCKRGEVREEMLLIFTFLFIFKCIDISIYWILYIESVFANYVFFYSLITI